MSETNDNHGVPFNLYPARNLPNKRAIYQEVFDYFLCDECEKSGFDNKRGWSYGKNVSNRIRRFTKVPETEETKELKEKLEKGESVMLTYNYPWYWVLRKNVVGTS